MHHPNTNLKSLTTTALLAILLAPISTHAAVTVDPNNLDHTDITDTTGSRAKIHAPGTRHIGHNGFQTGHLLINGTSTLYTAPHATIGYGTNSTGIVDVQGPEASWDVSDTITIGQRGSGTLNITNGATVTSYGLTSSISTSGTTDINISGPNSSLNVNAFIQLGISGPATLNISNNARLTTQQIHTSLSTGIDTLVNINNAALNNTNSMFIATTGNSTVNIENHSAVSSSYSSIAHTQFSNGIANITNSTLASQTLIVGRQGTGTLNIDQNATVTTQKSTIAERSFGRGTVNISNATWLVQDVLNIGYNTTETPGNATLNLNPNSTLDIGNTLNIGQQGKLNINGGTILLNNNIQMDVTPTAQIHFNLGTIYSQQDLLLNPASPIIQNFFPSNTITPAKTLRTDQNLTLQTPITLAGGTLAANTITNPSLLTFNSGTLQLINLNLENANTFGDRLTIKTNQNYNITNQFDIAQHSILTMQGGTLTTNNLISNGTIQGHGEIRGNLQLNPLATANIYKDQHLIFSGQNNINQGNINNYNGIITFQHHLTNNGNIQGSGIYHFRSGLTHQGKLNINQGSTQISGNITLQAGSQIITTSNATTTFYDNVTHNGDEIRTAENSTTTFFGNVTGAGNFTGQGTVNFEGTYTPGNSPAAITIDTNTKFQENSTLIIELAGTQKGSQYDHLEINNDLTILGDLEIQLLNDFQLNFNMSFNILTIDGQRAGTFNNLNQHDSVGTFNDIELFIDYNAGDGNDIDLFTLHLGDTNKDRLINQTDLNNITQNFNTNSTTGDSNHDGQTNLNDLFTTRNNFGNGASLASPIPEPTTLFTILALTPLLLKRNQKV